MTLNENYKIQHDVVILGSGFVGRTISHELSQSSIENLMVDMSLTRVAFSEMSKTPKYSNEQLARTKSRFGGLTAWGGAVSLPTKGEYFADPEYPAWNSKAETLDFKKASGFLGTDFRNFTLGSRVLNRANRIFPGLASAFALEPHTYTERRFGGELLSLRSIKKGVDANITDPVSVVAITRTNKIWTIEVSTVDGRHSLIAAKSLVFAGGAIGNAVLSHLVTGCSKFELGNHVSAKLGTLFFKKPRRIRGLVNSFDSSEGQFVTVSMAQDQVQLRCSLRFQRPECSEEGTRGKNAITKKFLAGKSMARRLLRLYNALDLRLMSEERLGFGGLNVRQLGPGEFELDVRVVETDETSIKELQSLTTKYLKSLGGIAEIRLHPKLHWSDAAHYFGTLPMRDERSPVSVDKFYKLGDQDEVYAVGSSSFARGGHAHPTLLSVATAIDFSDLFISGRGLAP